jgi:tRNA-Thr(GGU) m(6)t(6)A37 methyltransferase TsaA
MVMIRATIFILWSSIVAALPGHALPIYQHHQQHHEHMGIAYHPIGEFQSKLTPQTGAPRQGALQPGNAATILIDETYKPALRDLDKHEYIIVIYHMHLSQDWYPDVRPPGSKRSMGLFATRSPNRPNPIGFGVVKLNRIQGNMLYVSGIDAFDGTPVLDIKPWLPGIDCPRVNADPKIEHDLGIKGKE